MSYPTFLSRVEREIRDERERQDARWGEQNHPDMAGSADTQREARELFAGFAVKYKLINAGKFDPRDDDPRLDWTGILLEEVYEALAEEDPAKLRAELIQAGAVIVAWIECMDRRATAPASDG